MHIAIFVDFHDSSVGGVQTSVRGQRQGLEALGHTVTIVCPSPVASVDADPNVILLPTLRWIHPNGFPLTIPSRRVRHLVEVALAKRPKVDIIHAQTNIGVGLVGVMVARRLGVPLVQTMHGRDDVFARTYPMPYITTLAARTTHRFFIPHTTTVHRLNDTATAHNAWQVMVHQAQVADHVVMPARHFAQKFADHGVTQPMDVISNGISDNVLATLPTALRTRAPGKTLKVLWCGRMSEEKRPIDTIAAVAQVPGATLTLYGSGPLEKEIRLYVKNHHLSKKIHLKGRVEQKEILAAMRAHDVLLYPSYGFDNQPMVLLEAVAAGIPVIYCDPDLTECMPQAGAVLTDDATVSSLVTSLQILAQDPSRWKRMHTAMMKYRPKIAQSYHSKKMVTLYNRVIRQYYLK